MIAGTLGLLEEPADGPLEDYSSGGFDTLDVRETQTYLDGATIQEGRAAATVETEQEEIHVTGGAIEVEQVPANDRVWTEWIADVTDKGFVIAERTAADGDAIPFPFALMSARANTWVEPAELDPGQLLRNQDDRAELDVEFSGRDRDGSVDMTWGAGALKKDAINAEVGVGFKLPWKSTVVRGVIYASGYIAVYEPSTWGPAQFGRFVSEEILPIAFVPEDDEESEQDTLGEEGS